MNLSGMTSAHRMPVWPASPTGGTSHKRAGRRRAFGAQALKTSPVHVFRQDRGSCSLNRRTGSGLTMVGMSAAESSFRRGPAPLCASSQLLLASTTAGTAEWLEVLEGEWEEGASRDCIVGWKGHKLRLMQGAEDDSVTYERIGSYPLETDALLKKFPAMKKKLEACHTHEEEPSFKISLLEVAYTLDELEASVKSNPELWNDGAKPGAGALPRLQMATTTAGEMLALMNGTRGVCAVQLWNGWDTSQQYLYSPYVIKVLERVLSEPGIKVCLSTAPGEASDLALSAIVYVDKAPWNKWGPHLASFGFQDKLVGGSAYYKMLCGLVLGYKEDNVKSYVVNTSPPNALNSAVVSKVEADLRKLSKIKPRLPWNQAGSRGRKKQDKK